MTVYVESVGCCAPGLDGWAQAQPVLRGECAYRHEDLTLPPPQRLPANERRRASLAVRLGFRVAEDALGASARAPSELATVFASSDGDTQIVHRICLALAEPARVLSPTDFHNSVHNAAAGYWSIAGAARLPSASLSAGDASFAAGLLEACALVQVEALDCLLVAFEMRAPEPLLVHARTTETAAFALLLSARRGAATLASLHVELIPREAQTPIVEPGLEALRLGNPAARALPLLVHLARRESAVVVIDGAGEHSLRLTLQAP